MSGSRIGGIKAAITNKIKNGEDFYQRIGAIGGSTKTDKPKGFAYFKTLPLDDYRHPINAGKKGGQTSKRRSNVATN